jgi:Family of unknown function (DUF6266)
MASYINGITGPFVGKVGSIVGSSWKGTPYMKLRPQRRKAAGEKELANRNKFAMAQKWLKPVITVVRCGFKGYSERIEGFIAAKSYLLKNAFEGEKTEIVINPSLVKVSYGDLPLPNGITAAKSAPDQLEISWDTSDYTGNPFDQVMLLAYDIEKGRAIFNTTGQFRSVGKDTLHIPSVSPEKIYHIYVAFVAADRSRQSESVYMGTINF